jgi:chaperonin GroES
MTIYPSIYKVRNMNFRPLYDRVLVRRCAAEEKTAGGLIVPDTAKEKPQEAEVIAVGSGKVLDGGEVRKISLSVGDRILFGKYTGDEIKLDGVEHIILREEDVLAVVE